MVVPKEVEIPLIIAVPVDEFAKLNPLIVLDEKFLTEDAEVFEYIPITILLVEVLAPVMDKL